MSNEQSVLEANPLVGKIVGDLPQNLGIVPGESQKLKKHLVERDQDIGLLSKKQQKQARAVLGALVFPESEKPFLKPDNEPMVFGSDSLLPLVASSVRDEQKILMNIGMSAGSDVSPMLPAYVELGLQRLRALREAGTDAALRVFSSASVSVRVNSIDPEHVAREQEKQERILSAYIEQFHGELQEYIDLNALRQQVDVLPPEHLAERIEKIREGVSAEVLDDLLACGRNHGGADGEMNALEYTAYHTVEDFFQDEGPEENIVSIGGPGEKAFNAARFGPFKPEKLSVGIVVPPSVISRTPPYLDIPDGISMDEFVNGSSERMEVFLANPKNKQHKNQIPGARDLVSIARSISPHGDIAEGISLLRNFYSSLS